MKRKSNLSHRVVLWCLVLLLIVQLVTALGIRPAKTGLAVEEGRDYSGKLWVVNNDQMEFSVDISLEGEMSEYVTLSANELTFRSDDDAKSVGFEVHLPDEVPPGISTAKIIIAQKVASSGENTVSSRIVLKHKIFVQGPYPDKYIEAKLNFHEQGDEIAFVSEVENLGKKDIGSIQTTFYVNDKQKEEHIMETEETSLKRKENKLLRTKLDRSLFELGEFEVSAVTKFDDQNIELIKNLIVGKPEVDITYFDNYFIANKINQYSMDLLNKWNKRVKNVYVDVEVSRDDQKIDEFRTKSTDIEGEMLQRITDYLDAKDKGPGRYTFDMVVNFWSLVRMYQKEFQFESELVSEEEAESLAMAAPLTGGAAADSAETGDSSSSGSPFASILPWIIVGILLGIVGFYVVWRYAHREQYEEGGGML